MHRKVRIGFGSGICVVEGHVFKEHAVSLVLYWWTILKCIFKVITITCCQALFSQFLVNGFEMEFFTKECYKSSSKTGCESISQKRYSASWHGWCVWKTSEVITVFFNAVGVSVWATAAHEKHQPFKDV